MMITPMDYWKNGIELWFRTAEAQLELSFRMAALMPNWDAALESARGMRNEGVTLKSTTARPALRSVTKAAPKSVRVSKSGPEVAVKVAEITPKPSGNSGSASVQAIKTAAPAKPADVAPPVPVKASTRIARKPTSMTADTARLEPKEMVVHPSPTSASAERAESSGANKPAATQDVLPSPIEVGDSVKTVSNPEIKVPRDVTVSKPKTAPRKARSVKAPPASVVSEPAAVDDADTEAPRNRRRRAPAQLGMPPETSKVRGKK